MILKFAMGNIRLEALKILPCLQFLNGLGLQKVSHSACFPGDANGKEPTCQCK